MNKLEETIRFYRKGYKDGVFSHNEMVTAIKKNTEMHKRRANKKTTRDIDELNVFFL